MASDFPRHLLDVESLRRDQIDELLGLSARFKRERASARAGKGRAPRHELLPGRIVVTLFFEASTRTRSSFEVAAHALGADVLSFQKDASSVTKGESLQDTVRNLEAIGADVLVVRHPAAGAPRAVARAVRASVVNAGDGTHEHPTQALLDLYTMRERLGRLEGLRVAIVGDVLHSRVARSLSFGLVKMGADVTLIGPPTLIPPDAPAWGVQVSYDIDSILPKLDVCYVLRVQRERQRLEYFPSVREYSRLFGLTRERVEALPASAIVMHPGPMNRGVEIDSDVADLPGSVIEEQVTNGIAVRMSLLYLLLGGAGAGDG